MQDNELIIRSAATDLTADMAVAYKDLGSPSRGNLKVRIVVPEMAETDDTIVPTLHLSIDGSGAGEIQVVGETITKAGVDGGRFQYFIDIPACEYDYVGVALDITDADTGTDFDAGGVEVAIVPATQYDDHTR